ncbi:MAG: hypothetical protein GTO45_26515 [Candidatus Aminicenantes bacterium]|nr:hypothetical protein [Candidatus Aminicenantes bacterium]NIM82301.1 hypothetical protein [Candidatus Aminicenantes bacterium]NIN21684.1 hypothetical protein [Candidatus Aminicenantes bacterium]NIN45493.1 hypothetical protein [Candidatus Aminicenantes bacterium]NIN88324.1 hypothetical protein [Candidatus Aminicenantes bacterium]
MGLQSLPAKDREAVLAFQEKAGELQRVMEGANAAANEARRRLKFIKKALLDTPKADPRWGDEARALEKRLLDIGMKIYGDPTLYNRNEPRSPSLMDRVGAQVDATTGITNTTKRNYDIAADEFEKLLEELRQVIETDLKKLEEKLEAAGAPWTPGRGVPKWKKD